MDTSVLVSVGIHTELIIVSGQDRIEDDAHDGGDGKGSQGDGNTADRESRSVAQAEAAYHDDSRDNEVAGFGEINLVLNHVADTDCRDHSVEDETDTADDGGRHCADDLGHFGDEAQDDRIAGSEADDLGIIDLAQLENTGVLSVGRIGGTAEHTCQSRCQAVAHQCAVQAGILDKVLFGRRHWSYPWHS